MLICRQANNVFFNITRANNRTKLDMTKANIINVLQQITSPCVNNEG